MQLSISPTIYFMVTIKIKISFGIFDTIAVELLQDIP
jgi:hypothetical protein